MLVVPEYSTGSPSPTPCGLGSGPTNPGRTNLPQETLDFRRIRFSRIFSLLIPASSLPSRPRVLTVPLHSRMERSPTTPRHVMWRNIRSFGDELSPDHCRRETTRPVSCYALFKWWLPLSQHPGCLRALTSFSTELVLGGLSWRSGLLPSRPRSLSLAD